MIQTITMRSGATITATVRWTDVMNSAANVAGKTTWKSTNDALITVTVDATDSTIARITSTGTTGTAQVQATAPTSTENIITTMLDISIISADATTGTISVSGEGVVPVGFGVPPPPIMR